MRKLIALLLVLSLMTVSLAAVAETLNLDGIVSDSAVINTEIDIPEKTFPTESKAARTSDKVYDKGDAVVIETPMGVVLTCTVPEGFAYLTQDYFHDMAKYNRYYPNPNEVVEYFIEKEMHLNVFTTAGACLDTFIYVYSDTDGLDQAIGNANNLSDSDAAYVAEYLGNSNNVTFEYGMVGDQLWFITADLIESANMIVGFTWVNGHFVAAYLENVATESDIEVVLTELACVSFSER